MVVILSLRSSQCFYRDMRTGSDILSTNIPDLQSWISQSLNVAQNYKKTLIYAKSNLGTPKIRVCIPAKDTTIRKALPEMSPIIEQEIFCFLYADFIRKFWGKVFRYLCKIQAQFLILISKKRARHTFVPTTEKIF